LISSTRSASVGVSVGICVAVVVGVAVAVGVLVGVGVFDGVSEDVAVFDGVSDGSTISVGSTAGSRAQPCPISANSTSSGVNTSTLSTVKNVRFRIRLLLPPRRFALSIFANRGSQRAVKFQFCAVKIR
jgi:hypothetical protein